MEKNKELADKHIVIKPTTKKKLKIWMVKNDLNTWDQGINQLLKNEEKMKNEKYYIIIICWLTVQMIFLLSSLYSKHTTSDNQDLKPCIEIITPETDSDSITPFAMIYRKPQIQDDGTIFCPNPHGGQKTSGGK
jgi:hypothetical protein